MTVIVDHGRVVANDTLAGLYRRLPASNKLLIDLVDGPAAPDMTALRSIAGVKGVESAGNRLSVWLEDLSADAPAVLGWLAQKGRRYDHLTTEAPNLETVFLTLTGRSLRDS